MMTSGYGSFRGGGIESFFFDNRYFRHSFLVVKKFIALANVGDKNDKSWGKSPKKPPALPTTKMIDFIKKLDPPSSVDHSLCLPTKNSYSSAYSSRENAINFLPSVI